MESRWRRLLFLYLLGPFQLSSIYLKETALFQIFLERLYVMDYLLLLFKQQKLIIFLNLGRAIYYHCFQKIYQA